MPDLNPITNFASLINHCGGMCIVGHEVQVKAKVEVEVEVEGEELG
jgi:hypothetical protein